MFEMLEKRSRKPSTRKTIGKTILAFNAMNLKQPLL